MGVTIGTQQDPVPTEDSKDSKESEVSVHQPPLDHPLVSVQLTGRHIDYLCLTGSRLYGLSRSDSDYDYLGFGVPIPNDMYSLDPFSCYTTQQKKPDDRILLTYRSGHAPKHFDVDLTIFSIRRLMFKLLKRDIHWLEALFVPPHCLVTQTAIGAGVRNNRGIFLTKGLYDRYKGYATTEWRRTIGEKTGKLGKVRKEDIEIYGYSRKNARNCLRLLQEGALLLRTGEMHFPLPDNEHDLLLEVSNGQLSLKEVEKEYKRCLLELDESVKMCSFPEDSDHYYRHVNNLLVQACKLISIEVYGGEK